MECLENYLDSWEDLANHDVGYYSLFIPNAAEYEDFHVTDAIEEIIKKCGIDLEMEGLDTKCGKHTQGDNFQDVYEQMVIDKLNYDKE